MVQIIGEVAHDPVNARRQAEGARTAHRQRQSIVTWALLIVYFLHTNCHVFLLGYTPPPPPRSIQTAPVVGRVAHDPVNAHRQDERVRTINRRQ
jgi:hypothetical protein